MEPRYLLSSAIPTSALPPGTYGVNSAAGLEIGISPIPNVNTPQFLLLDSSPSLQSDGTLAPFDGTTPTGLTPTQVRHAYGVDQVMFGSLVGDGTGQTIAIVDAYDYPTVQTDLHAFDLAFGLPDVTVKRVNEDGGSALPGVDPTGKGGWEVEEALDVEWAHSMAPKANIVLVEATAPTNTDLIQHAVGYARTIPGVSAVSMSFGINGGFSGENTFDTFFTTPAGHAGVTFLAATGDDGTPGGYPAESPNVVAVGGTTLNVSASGNYLGESGWAGSGGGLSLFESQPAYQVGVVTQSQTRRAIPDVSFVADPDTGVSVYDSYDFGINTPWATIGGTSLACPCWAGLVAIADQGRAASGLSSLGGADSILPHLYHLNGTANFHDITTGNNGFAAGPGYDLVTGIGSPKANLLLNQLDSVPTLIFLTQPSNVLPHHAISPGVTVALEDQFGAIETGAISNVTITVASGPGTLGGTLTVALTNGVATFSDLTLGTPGNYTLSVSDVDAGVGATASGPFTVLAPPTQLVFSTQPTTSAAGQPITGPVTVTIEDANGTVVNENAPITLSVAGGPGALSGTVTVNAANGVAVFTSAILTRAGSYVLGAADPLDLLSGFTSSSFIVNSGPAATLTFEQNIANVVAGSVISPAILIGVSDAFGNILSSSSANIALTVNSGPGFLFGPTTAATSGGVATFGSLFLTRAGDYTLTATDMTDNFSAISSTFTVSPAAATSLTFLQPPTSIIAGQLFSPATSVVLTDPFGNIATNNSSNVTVAIASGPGSLLGTRTISILDGVASFGDLTIKKAGTYSFVVVDSNSSLSALHSGSFNVNAGPASTAVFMQQPNAITTNGNFTLTLQVQDAAGNFIGNSNAPVRLSLVGAPAGSKLNGTLTVRAVNGVVTVHNVSLSRNTGLYTLGSTIPGYGTSYSSPIIVSGTPAKLAVGKQPAGTVAAGTALSAVTVQILDMFGNVAAANSAITVSLIGPNGAVLGGTKTLHAVNGVVTFSGLTISQAGSYTLRFTDGSLTAATSRTFTVTSPPVQGRCRQEKGHRHRIGTRPPRHPPLTPVAINISRLAPRPSRAEIVEPRSRTQRAL